MGYVIYGAGAIGGVIGARLFQTGCDVTLIARGAHAAAMRERGLRLRSPADDVTLAIPVVEHPSELEIAEDDVVVLAVKSDATAAAVDALVAGAPPSIRLVCAQNGVENERVALRFFEHVVAMCVMMPAVHLEPGEVLAFGAPVNGLLDVGRYPAGVDDAVGTIAADLAGAGFDAVARPDIMRWKHAKLLLNLGNVIEAACGPEGTTSDIAELARSEGIACFDAAGIACTSADEERERRGDLMRIRPIAGERRGGGSTWQSLARGSGRLETDFLNGEVVMLGRRHDVATPVNLMLQRLARDLAAGKAPPGSLPVDSLRQRLAAGP